MLTVKQLLETLRPNCRGNRAVALWCKTLGITTPRDLWFRCRGPFHNQLAEGLALMESESIGDGRFSKDGMSRVSFSSPDDMRAKVAWADVAELISTYATKKGLSNEAIA